MSAGDPTEQELQQRLSRISTVWTRIGEACGGPAEKASDAHRFLVERYGGAVYRYLLAALRDQHAAEELTQEFALALVRGDFHRAHPQRGRFRDYIKTVLFHFVSRYRKQQMRRRAAALDGVEPVVLPSEDDTLTRQFDQNWRADLLGRCWITLADQHPQLHQVLRFRADHPEMPSHRIAEELGAQLGRNLTAASIRQTLHRAREKFADCILDEVAASLEQTTLENIEAELLDLDLMQYCRPALERYTRKD